MHGDLVSANFCQIHQIQTTEMEKKPLETAIKGSKSQMTQKATLNLNIQGFQLTRTFYVANIRQDIIFGEPILRFLQAEINVANNTCSIQPPGKNRFQLQMLNKSNPGTIYSAALYCPPTAETESENDSLSESETEIRPHDNYDSTTKSTKNPREELKKEIDQMGNINKDKALKQQLKTYRMHYM
jgi:hypothetical protein